MNCQSLKNPHDLKTVMGYRITIATSHDITLTEVKQQDKPETIVRHSLEPGFHEGMRLMQVNQGHATRQVLGRAGQRASASWQRGRAADDGNSIPGSWVH